MKAVSYTHLDVYKRQPAIKTYAVETCADLDALSAALKG